MYFKRALLASLLIGSTTLAGCQNMSAGTLLETGMAAVKTATLSDAEVAKLADQACAEMDSQAQIPPPSNVYAKRLDKIAKALGNQINGIPVSYKVYMTKEVNAFAMANGCVRVYSGLMDLMTDNEVEGVLGHELGHVALGHTKKSIQIAYAAQAARGAASAAGGALADLSDSQVGEIAESLVNAQFSQSQENDSDNFSYDLLKQRGIKLDGLASAFEKLAKEGGGGEDSLISGMFSSHPGAADRAAHIRQRIASDK